MVRNLNLCVCLCLTVILTECYAHVLDKSQVGNDSKLLIVSFDGFRFDYLDKVPTPNFERVWKYGVKAKWIKNAYVTKTFPNHYSIATGLFEETHGILNNHMYDPVWNQTFQPRHQSKQCEFFGGEPIWVTNQNQGQNHKSGVCYWIGSDCETPIGGVHPTFYESPYTTKVPFKDRADKVLSWFTEKDINLGLLYYQEPDSTGHEKGPDSPEMDDMIKQCDKDMGYLLDQIEKSSVRNKLNLIVTSDHGMSGYPTNQTIYLDDYISPDMYFSADGTPFKNIWPKEGQTEAVYNKLKTVPHLNVFYKDEIPEKFHYKHNRRVGPIFTMSDVGWQVVSDRTTWTGRGDHGWSNEFPEMHPFFLARGPAFKTGVISEPFNNVDIYPLMCHLLNLTPAPNNGSLDNVKHLLQEHSVSGDEPVVKLNTFVFVLVYSGGVGIRNFMRV